MSDTYLEQVVHLGDDASKMLFEACKATWPNREGLYGEVNADLENFRGWRNWSIAPLLEVEEPEGLIFDQQADGIGTKVRVSQGSSSYTDAGSDLMAMAADDAAARGLEPILVTTGLNINKFTDENKQWMEQLAHGGIRAANIARVALYGGETAVLGDLVGGYSNPNEHLHFTWEATVHAVGHKKRFIDNIGIRPGMAIVGLREDGLRSNGISMVRAAFRSEYGDRWYRRPFETDEGTSRLGAVVVRGSAIYTPVFVDAIGGYDLSNKQKAQVEGAAHITGGGVTKLAEMLQNSGYGADIEDPYEPPAIMKEVLRIAGMSDENAYQTLHMGMGMAVVSSEPDKFITVAAENGVEAKVIGEVTDKPEVVIRSAGLTDRGSKLTFEV